MIHLNGQPVLWLLYAAIEKYLWTTIPWTPVHSGRHLSFIEAMLNLSGHPPTLTLPYLGHLSIPEDPYFH